MGQDIKLFDAIYQKMNWQEQRQKTLAQNIANADTPDYIPQDLKPLAFKDLLETTTSKLSMSKGSPSLATTNSMHIDTGGNSARTAKSKEQRHVYETAPAGNSVILEEQLIKANELASDHRMISNIYQKNLNMLRTALRGSGQ